MSTPYDQDDDDEEEFEDSSDNDSPSWGVEIELSSANEKSVFRSARRVILDGQCAQVQLKDGSYEAWPIGLVRKVLSMRAADGSGYTDESLSEDGIY